jgi:hypothetical protein
VRPAHFELVDELLSLELAPLLLDEGLDGELGEALGEAALPVLGDDVSELVLLPVLGEVVAPELMLPPLGGAPASLPDEDAPLPLAPDAPEELSDELEPELPLLAPALAPPPAAPPAPCAQAAVAKATMAAVTAALMSFRFIFSSSRVGMEMDCGGRGRKNSADASPRKLCVRSKLAARGEFLRPV